MSTREVCSDRRRELNWGSRIESASGTREGSTDVPVWISAGEGKYGYVSAGEM